MRAEGLEVECVDSAAGVYRLTAGEIERLCTIDEAHEAWDRVGFRKGPTK